MCVGEERGKLRSPRCLQGITARSSINSIWSFAAELSTSTNGRLSSSNLLFCAFKSVNRRQKSAARTLISSANCAREHTGRELLFHGLAARKVAQVSFVHLCLPQSQVGLERLHWTVHIRGDATPTLQLHAHLHSDDSERHPEKPFHTETFGLGVEWCLSLCCPRTYRSPQGAGNTFAAPFPG